MNQRHTQRRGLGRGLGALIPTAPAEEPAGEVGGSGDGTPQASDDRGTSPNGTTFDHGATGEARDGAGGHDGESFSAPGSAASTDGAGAAEVAGAYFREVPVGQITPNPRQPREVFGEEAMAELVHSIREIGLLQPIVVRETGPDAYELVMGERRWRASQQAGLEVIPAIVRQTGDDDMLRDALLENLHRSQLNPLEEADAYAQMLDDFGCTHDDLARRIGRSRPQISNTLRLMKLSPAVQRRVAAGVLSAGHARSLLAVEDGEVQDRLAQ
ncbi:MAG TPA: ParB/RepB/Spo0J family partition protein, partial [Pedococcus sp.]|nr:ParB/RepB/Spo0J family partition protein [Pedococcus sp.]